MTQCVSQRVMQRRELARGQSGRQGGFQTYATDDIAVRLGEPFRPRLLLPAGAPPEDVSRGFVTEFGPDAMEQIQRAELKQVAASVVQRLVNPRYYTRGAA